MMSVIIPCLNEENNLGALLAQLIEQKDIDIEIIVVDGGSTDGTILQAEQYGARVLHAKRGRGRQQNVGAAAATGEYLLFLHADSRLEQDNQLSLSLSWIKAAGKRTAGHFRLRFETDNPAIKERLRLFEYKTQLNREGTFSGDQGLLILRSDFKLMGGYSETYPFLEDKEFAERFVELGHFETIPSTLHTSARRFEQEGLYERLILNALIMGMFHLGNDYFFTRATDAYRDNNPDGTLNLTPFFQLAHEAVFSQGAAQGVVSWLKIGRYATKNLWQVRLSHHLRRNDAGRWLDNYDRYLKPLTDNPVGYLLGSLIVLTWFYSWRFRPRTKQT